MRLTLADISACLEGVIPAIIGTCSADGRPNVSYLSQVAALDASHIALSNQFFSKTSLNLRADPRATVLVVDGQACRQYLLDVAFVDFMTAGERFDTMAARVVAGSARVGLAKEMRLRSVDVFRVDAIRAVPLTGTVQAEPPARAPASLGAIKRVVEELSDQSDVDGLVDATLNGLRRELAMSHVLFLWLDEGRGQLTAIGSRGYDNTGIGSDIALGEGIIGVTAASRKAIRINDLGRSALLSAAIARLPSDENLTRRIAVPGLVDALSQVAVPITVRGEVRGVLFAESAARAAFGADDEAGMLIVAYELGSVLALIEAQACGNESEPGALEWIAGARDGIRVMYYEYDDSVFIDGEYVIKGVAGRLLHYMLKQQQLRGRVEFTNREIRLEPLLRLPMLKDNLETRLLLLRRRLEEKKFPVRLVRTCRGRVALRVDGELVLNTVADDRGEIAQA